jgi:hypothetical protein
MSIRRSVCAAITTATLVAGGFVARPGIGSATTPTTPLRLHAPTSETVYSYKGRVYDGMTVELEAVGNTFEIWSHRANYRSPITSEWHNGSTVTQLPAGLMDNFSGLSRFVDVSIENSAGRIVLHRKPTVCLNGYETYRVVPDGASHSTYPYGCPYNIFAKGSVQGIAAGWATEVPVFGYRPIRLAPGHYTMRITITPLFRSVFGIPLSDARRSVSVNVKTVKDGGGGVVGPPVRAARTHVTPHLTGKQLAGAPTTGPRPDLVAAPAWSLSLSRKGNLLNFAATVWNAGDSPLVVDGFREPGKAVMDAYQYFYDAQGNQTDYLPAGHMIWDPRPSHHHWHFEDFARYELLDASKTKVQRSHKEAFCLANTDAMDMTLPAAQWRPDNTDLSTACGGEDALAVSEYLAAGSGDTYMQSRAGQSFSIANLPNGIYYIAVQANPDNVLYEQSTANNLALRKLRLGGTPDHRTLQVFPYGDITG